ncbi:hypothetical protein ACES2L_05020 [Bdellovibrio bacteriovorus]
MKTSKQQIINVLLTLTAAALLVGCSKGAQVGSEDFSSRVTESDITASSAKPLAYCNQAVGTEITSKMKVYTENNAVRMDLVYVRMTAVPASFKNDQSYISMWKWLSNSAGNTYLDSSALEFILVDATNNQALTNWKTTLKWSDVAAAASGLGITDPTTFFNRVNILVNLKDAQGEYDALKITHYNLSTHKAISQTDGLLPMFYANPNDYATEASGQARAEVLKNLHPFANQVGQGFSSTQFQSMANAFCF